jgi:hypothetical protein
MQFMQQQINQLFSKNVDLEDELADRVKIIQDQDKKILKNNNKITTSLPKKDIMNQQN